MCRPATKNRLYSQTNLVSGQRDAVTNNFLHSILQHKTKPNHGHIINGDGTEYVARIRKVDKHNSGRAISRKETTWKNLAYMEGDTKENINQIVKLLIGECN